MMKYLSLEDVKQHELDILKYVDAVCKEYNLRYFLSFGTLIGAIRHKGFIPWDDDIDISMPREDYDRFVEITKNTKGIYITLYPEKEGYPYPFVKVVDTNTKLAEEDVMDIPDNGLWVDIFPLDGYTNSKPSFTNKFATALERARSLATYDKCPERFKNQKLLWLIARCFGYKFFQKKVISLCKKSPYATSKYVGYAYGAAMSVYPGDFFNELIRAPFEDGEFLIPARYDEYLTLLYGDYMKIPSEDQQISHCVKAILKD